MFDLENNLQKHFKLYLPHHNSKWTDSSIEHNFDEITSNNAKMFLDPFSIFLKKCSTSKMTIKL